MHCANCGAPLDASDRHCKACGAPVPAVAAPMYAAPPAAKPRSALLWVVVAAAVVLVVGIAAAVFFFGGFGTGDCVYVFEGVTNRYPNYTEAECDAFCADVRFGSCYWEPYLVRVGRGQKA